jgi:hypothetical protein
VLRPTLHGAVVPVFPSYVKLLREVPLSSPNRAITVVDGDLLLGQYHSLCHKVVPPNARVWISTVVCKASKSCVANPAHTVPIQLRPVAVCEFMRVDQASGAQVVEYVWCNARR